MKLFILFLYIFILSIPLFAQRVIVTKTAHKNNLKIINSKLKSLNVKMYVKRFNNYYFIYTKNYQTQREAQGNLKKIHTLFPNAKLANEQKMKPKTEQKNQTSHLLKEKRDWIVGVGIGGSTIKDDANNSLSFSGSRKSINYSLKAGYFITDSFLSAISYSSFSVDKTTISNAYLSADYYYNITQNNAIYIGGILGYSQLSIDLKDSTPSTSEMYGVEIGASYDILGCIPISLTYQSIFLNHTIKISGNGTEKDIKTNFQSVIELGIGYKF